MRQIAMKILILLCLSSIVSFPLLAQISCNGQTCNSDGTSTSLSTRSRILYTSNGSVTVGNNSNARSTMLPPAQAGTSLLIPAGKLPVGSALILTGKGLISARTTTPGSFSLYPNITPSGGSKTDLGGLTVTPLIGIAAYCEIWLTVFQTPTGLLTSGVVKYGADNGQAYSVNINPSATIVASDPSVDRTLGVDGQWATADAANYVTPNAITIVYMPTAS